MLSFYIKSVIVYLIIYWALRRILRNSLRNRKDINYKDYAKKQTGKGTYYIFCFIPIIRIFIIGIILFISYGSKDMLDKAFNKNHNIID